MATGITQAPSTSPQTALICVVEASLRTASKICDWADEIDDVETPSIPQHEVDTENEKDARSSMVLKYSHFTFRRLLVNMICHLRHKLQLLTLSHQSLEAPTIVVVALGHSPWLPLAICAIHLLPMLRESNTSRQQEIVMVPLNPGEGIERLKHIYQTIQPSMIVTCGERNVQRMQQALPSRQDSSDTASPSCLVVDVNHVDLDKSDVQSGDDASKTRNMLTMRLQNLHDVESQQQSEPDVMSHICFTSGTTGIPKGCVSSRKALKHYCLQKNRLHNISKESHVLLASSTSFDPCLSDILATLIYAEATLVIPASPSQLLQMDADISSCVTHVLCTPTVWQQVASKEFWGNLQVVALGGEFISRRLQSQWANSNNDDTLQLYATYGVTEACVYQTMGQIVSTNEEQGFVGKQFPGMKIQIVEESDLNGNGRLEFATTDGVLGEVILSGTQLDQWSGYYEPYAPQDASSGTTSPSPFVHQDGAYFYRTGDLGVLRNGNLYLKGRRSDDRMVKINGVRVELGEIEAAMEACGSEIVSVCLAQVVDSSQDNDTRDKQVHLYIVLSDAVCLEIGLDWIDVIENKKKPRGIWFNESCPLWTLFWWQCRQRTRVMPSAFVLIPATPLSSTGKSDRTQLPSLSECATYHSLRESSAILLTDFGKSGATLASIIIECLNLQPCQQAALTTSASFAMLGGDSLAATRIVRTLYASHHGVHNSRFLGGVHGTLDGAFDVTHLIGSLTLGDYVEWLDQNGICTTEDEGSNTRKAMNIDDEPTVLKSVSSMHSEEGNDMRVYDALLEASTLGQTQIAAALLKAGIDPNLGQHGGRLGKVSSRLQRRQEFKSNPLHIACGRGDANLVQKLLEYGCKSNAPDASGNFPLHLAAASVETSQRKQRDRTECVRLLLEAGSPISMKDGNKQTVIHSAARAGNCFLLRYLLDEWKASFHNGRIQFTERKGKVNKIDWQDRWYRTAVHWAVLNGHADALDILLSAGMNANPPQPKNGGKSTSVALESPLEICHRKFVEGDERWVKIRNLLEQAILLDAE